MFPILIDLGHHRLPLLGEVHLALPTYGFLFAVGVLLSWWWFMRRGRALGVADERLFNLSFYSLLVAILSAKLVLVLLEWRTYLLHPGELLGVFRAAGVLIGGVVAGATVFFVAAMPTLVPDLGFDPLSREQMEVHKQEVLRIAQRLLDIEAAPGS